MNIVTEKDFIKTHGTSFYTKYPTEESFRKKLEEKVDFKVNNSPARVDTDFFDSNKELFINTLTRHFYSNAGYLQYLRFYYSKKLKVDTNALNKAMKLMGKGIKIINSDKSDSGFTEFKNSGGDPGRAIITNLSYKEIATCRKDKPVDILMWDSFNDITDLKHFMRPAFWKNIIEGDFDGRDGQHKCYDTTLKIVSMFTDRASVFNTKVYSSILSHYAPTAEHAIHFVGSWNTPTLAAPALTRLKHQVIIDVIPRQKEVSKFIHDNFIPSSLTNPKHKLDFIICPSEQLDARLSFSEKYPNYFDVQLFSPVYFSTEMYNSVDGDAGEQSIDSFPSYEEWLEGYFHGTIKTAFNVMKPGSKFIIVISDFEYYDRTTKKYYYISRDFLNITNRYFKHIETATLTLTSGSGFTNKALKEKRRAGRKNLFSEHIHVFTKDLDYIPNGDLVNDRPLSKEISLIDELKPDFVTPEVKETEVKEPEVKETKSKESK